MIVGRTQRAIVDLLVQYDYFMHADDIFLLLNKDVKNYSYAAVYHNLRQLAAKGILISQLFERRNTFTVNQVWKKDNYNY